MSGHFILMAAIFIAPHLKERSGQLASRFCIAMAGLAMVLDFALILARASGWLK